MKSLIMIVDSKTIIKTNLNISNVLNKLVKE